VKKFKMAVQGRFYAPTARVYFDTKFLRVYNFECPNVRMGGNDNEIYLDTEYKAD
jgi:hypothetical protein